MKYKDIILFTTFYPHALNNLQRFSELKKALQLNLENKFITEIVIFFQRETKDFDPFENGFEFLQNPKIKLHFLTNKPIQRPNFKALIEFANKHYPNKHIVLCNSDIFFYKDAQIERLTELQNHNEIWFLTRYYYKKELNAWILDPIFKSSFYDQEDIPDFQNWKTIIDLQEYKNLGKIFSKEQSQVENYLSVGSADSYCFYAPLEQTNFNIFIGSEGCDSYFIMKAYHSNLKVLSPSFSIISRHLHHSEIRNYYEINYRIQTKDCKYTYYYYPKNCTLEKPQYLEVSPFFIIKTKYWTTIIVHQIIKNLKSFSILYPMLYQFLRKFPFLHRFLQKIFYHKL